MFVSTGLIGEDRTASERRKLSGRSVAVQFSLMGFTQDTGFRVFAFEGIAADRTKLEYTVRADLALSRQYGIRMQELPLLCRGLLERNVEGEQNFAVTFSEDEMRLHARTCAEARLAAIHKKKPVRRSPTAQIGSGWRVPQQS
jgi:hypothetical protein